MARRQSLRDRWYCEVIRTQRVNGACRELLSLLAVRHMTGTGVFSVPRAVLADELGVLAQRITDRIMEATAAGLLVRVGGGYNGAPARYRALLPGVKVPPLREPSGGLKVSAEPIPSGGLKVSAGPIPSGAEGNGQADTFPAREGIGRAGTIRARAPLPTNPTPYTTARDVPPRTDRDRGTRGPPTEDAAATAERNGQDGAGDYSDSRSRLAAQVEQGNHRPRARVNGSRIR